MRLKRLMKRPTVICSGPLTLARYRSPPVDLVQDLRRLISLDTFNQLGKASIMMLTSKETLLPLFGALALVGFSLYSRQHFNRFLERSASRVGKVTGITSR